MASVLATPQAETDLVDDQRSDGHESPMDRGRALGGGMCGSVGLYFDLMEITTIMHHRPAGDQHTVSVEDHLPVTLRRR